MIEIENLKIGYQFDLLTIDHLILEKGKTYALIGANGSGKSTFLKTLSGQIKSLSGQIELNKKKLFQLDHKDRSRTIAFIRTTIQSVEYLTVENYIALGRTPYTNALGRLKAEDYMAVDSTIHQLKIEHLRHKFLTEISDGEKQLATVCRALAQQTPIILLDEPTSFLDYVNREKLLTILINLALENEKCILFSSHDLDSLLELGLNLIGVNKETRTIEHIPLDYSKNDIKRIYFH